jgi:hypothetical protein
MPSATWNHILEAINRLSIQDQQTPRQAPPSRVDEYRRSKIHEVEKVTGRPLIVYASACISPNKSIPGQMLMLDFSDKIGFKTVTEHIPPPDLDILVHIPGGYPEATESLVQQLRQKYSTIRFIVPAFAKSAATMFAMSGDEILMAEDAELGPIDPQMLTVNGTSPAESIREQFKKAQAELKEDASKLPSWMPILSQLGPSLLVDCEHAIDLAKSLVTAWTRSYMLKNDPDAENKSAAIAQFLGDHSQFKSHARAVKIPELERLGVRVTDISKSTGLNKAVEELYCCLDILLGNSPVYKVFENSRNDALIRQSATFPQMIQAIPAPLRVPQQH